ncbi:hypothetical protein [Anaerotruncus rubiinfantis]|uniref:hypothetical protein n=1 Tax=Anaerotruncus rubiinfantis TaxID=1720200 RepID=UPI003C2DC21D
MQGSRRHQETQNTCARGKSVQVSDSSSVFPAWRLPQQLCYKSPKGLDFSTGFRYSEILPLGNYNFGGESDARESIPRY